MSLCPPCNSTVLDAESDELGAITPEYGESGTATLASGISSKVITFATTKASAEWYPEMSIENTVDANPLWIGWQIVARSTTGFTLALSGVTDTENYILKWAVQVR